MGGGGFGGAGGFGANASAGGFGAGAGFGGNVASSDTRPAREKYATQLEQVKEMGFNDEEVILKILEQTNGSVQLALEVLFQQLGDK